MYKIEFDPAEGKFVILILKFSVFWKPIKKLEEPEQKKVTHLFDDYFEALEHVKRIGLDQLYQDKSVNKYQAALRAAGSY